MNWLVVIISEQTYTEATGGAGGAGGPAPGGGYHISSIRCFSKKAAEEVVAWLTDGAWRYHVHCLIIQDTAK